MGELELWLLSASTSDLLAKKSATDINFCVALLVF